MTKDFLSALSPLLMVNYVFGLRIIKSPVGYIKVWFNLLYILLLWSIHFILIQYTIMFHAEYNFVHSLFLWMDVFTILLSVTFAVYHNKKFIDCLKKLILVDDTLEKLGIKTDYYKLYIRMVWLVMVWFVVAVLMIYGEIGYFKNQFNFDIPTALYTSYMTNCCTIINFIGNLTFTSILGYVGIKFDQINKYLRSLGDNKCEIKWTWENLTLPKRRFSKTSSNTWMTWFVIHLHAELRKICREIDSIFGAEITMSMACYFCWLGYCLHQIFYAILVDHYVSDRNIYIILVLVWVLHYVFKLLIINYICERVGAKANATADLINRILYSTYVCDIEVQENISQFLLQVTQSPVRFYGIGLFQFGFKILYEFSTFIITVLVVLVQGYANK